MKTKIITLLNKTFDRAITENKKFFVIEFLKLLNANGYTVEKEVRHPFLENAKVNFRVSKDGCSCWIELDNKTPRLRSIESIKSITDNDQCGFIYLRNSFVASRKYLGLDVISARR
ncbi:MAG: hypothetical protein [Caudoviricetes sp.]|nr:MAG: hypothetical protein [Caudoviricetes sp.]